MTPAEGDRAPAFTLPDGSGGRVSLRDFRGKRLVLYFYPKDDTSGCTAQACDFRDNLARIRKQTAEVVGVSRDSVASHQRFAGKYDLPFTLLSDEQGGTLEAYGVWQRKTFMGRKFMGIVRTTFIVDGSGVIRKVFPKVRVKGHVDEVLEALGALEA